MKETFNCPCKKEETELIRIYYAEGQRFSEHFLKLSPQAKRLLNFLAEEGMLHSSVYINWNFNVDLITEEF